MAQGIFKNGQAIEVTYQATAVTSGLSDVKMDVYDEGHLIDVGKGVAAMTEIASTGRYYTSFTPDAEGEWTVEIDSITKPGKIVKKYSVVAHNVDSIGDAVATADSKIETVDTVVDAIKVVTDAESGTKAAVAGLQNISKAEVNTEVDSALASYDGPTKAEMDSKIESISLESGPMVG